MSHGAHCNHSYLCDANYSFEQVCNDAYMETLGQRIKRYREERKLSQQEVADKVGVSRVAVTKWESEQTANLKLGNLLGICELFDVAIEVMIRGEQKTQKKDVDLGNKIAAEPAQATYAVVERSESAWGAYCSADRETRCVVDFVLLGENDPLPEWATNEMRKSVDAMRYTVTKWERKKSG